MDELNIAREPMSAETMKRQASQRTRSDLTAFIVFAIALELGLFYLLVG